MLVKNEDLLSDGLMVLKKFDGGQYEMTVSLITKDVNDSENRRGWRGLVDITEHQYYVTELNNDGHVSIVNTSDGGFRTMYDALQLRRITANEAAQRFENYADVPPCSDFRAGISANFDGPWPKTKEDLTN